MVAADPADPAEPSQGRTDGEHALADPGQRLVARLIDMLAVGLPVVVGTQALLPEKDAELVAPLVLSILLLAYDAVQLALWGRTLGKRITGIRVVRPGQEGRLPVGWALLRAACYALPIAARPVPVLSVLAGLFWVVNVGAIFEGARRQALHDRLVGSFVVVDTSPRVSDLPGGPDVG